MKFLTPSQPIPTHQSSRIRYTVKLRPLKKVQLECKDPSKVASAMHHDCLGLSVSKPT
jgi:hypothetical protein